MAPTLTDFNKKPAMQQLRMDAFQPVMAPSPAANAETINTIASYGAALDLDGQIDSVYKSIANQLSYSTSSPTLESVLSKWRQNDVQGSMDTLRSILADPNVPDEVKQNTLYSFQTGQEIKPLSHNVGMSALMADDIENGEQEEQRISLGERYDRVDQYNAWVQQSLNVLNSQNSVSWQTNVKGFVESIVPFADPARAALFEQMVDVDGTGDAGDVVRTLTLLGEGRNDLRETLARIPVDKRQPIVQNLMNIIRSTAGSNTDNLTMMKNLHELELMITPGGYDGSDRWVDNIFSVLDDTIILAPFSKGIRGVGNLGAIFKGTDEANVAAEIIARGERAAQESVEVTQSVIRSVDEQAADAIEGRIPSIAAGERTTVNAPYVDRTDVDAANAIEGRPSTRVTMDEAAQNAVEGASPPTIDYVRGRQISSNVQANAVAPIYINANPGKAVIAHNAVLATETDQAAKILYGTTRQNALAHDYLPEVGGNGRVANKIEYDEATSTPDTSIIKHVKESEGVSWADVAEKAEAQKRVVNDWKNTVGVSNRSAMGTIENVDTGVRLNQVYGPGKGGFSNAYTGIDVVRTALRKYGVKDDELTILSRQPDGSYAPVTKSTNLTKGDYLVQVNYDYRFDPNEVDFTGYEVSKLWGFLPIPDIRFFNKDGGITQQIVPKSVNIDPRAFIPGVAAADRASGIQRQFLKKGKEFADRWKKMGKIQQDKVDSYIRKANAEEIPFNVANIRGQGINDAGVEVLARWKQLQDTIGYFENADAAKTLRGRGWEILDHTATDTRIIVQPVGKTTIKPNTEIYDVATDSFIVFSQKNLDDLYERGGAVVQPRNEYMVQNRKIDYILASNDGSGAFSRRIRDDDRILNYRHGYYHVKYTDPFYITRRDPKTGKVSVIARAENGRDARLEAQRLNETKDGYEYKEKRDNAAEAFDNHLDTAISHGRSAQRLRGKRLERVGASNDKGITDNGIESPMDSLTRSISSISHRASFRSVIDAEKQRWRSQFKHLMPMTENGPKFPTDVKDILDGPGANAARHAYRHIEQLQDGYGNMLDDLSKGFFNKMGDVTGWAWADKMAKFSPSGAARMTAFKLMLASNPLRQLPVQALPALPIMASLNPLGIGRTFKRLGVVAAWHRGVDLTVTNKIAKYGLDMNETRDMLEAYELSGMSGAVNAHSYLSDDVARLADRNVAQKALTILGKPLKIAQSVGFDLGEQSLMSMVWLNEWDRMTRSLKRSKLTPTERDTLVAKVRAITGDMNRGGDMPYNSNSFSVVMQFLQTPHKIASGLILGHKGLTGAERLKLAAGYTLTFGLPVLPIIDKFVDGVIPAEDPQARDIIKGGLANVALNRFLSSLSGEDTRVDFSQSLQPFTLEPMIEFAGNLMTLNVQDFVAGTAAVSLIAENGRINRFARSVVSWLVPGEDVGVDETKQVALTAMQMFSGLSNTWKAMQIMQTGKITTATGGTVDEDVSYMEALMKAAGFQTMDEVYYWAGNQAKWEIDGGIQKDVESLVDDLFTKYTREGQDPAEMEQYLNVMRHAAQQFNNPQYLDRVSDYYKFKMRQNPKALYALMLESGIYTQDEVIKVINNSNFTPEQRETLMAMYNITGESYGD
jgi:hypothetical protein